jgi:hypothetical protein
VPEFELPVVDGALEVEVVLVGVGLVLVEVELGAAVVLVAARAASAGSCPRTSVTVISSQVARNSATAPPITRRRIVRRRASRACRTPPDVGRLDFELTQRSIRRARINSVRDV